MENKGQFQAGRIFWCAVLVISVGLDTAKIVSLSWPDVALLVTATLVWYVPLKELVARIRKVKTKDVEIILDELERTGALTAQFRSELSGLSSNDVWALSSFAEKGLMQVGSMSAALRVAARVLVDLRLLKVVESEVPGDSRVALTPLGEQVLKAAKSISV